MTLGLFPLNLVLFPEVRLPLHIFEPRYRALINECLERGSEFGINLIEEGRLHPVGCSAIVVDVTERHPDGRLDIVVEGLRRYRLLEIVSSESPYTVGNVEEYLDTTEGYDGQLLDDVLGSYNRIVNMVYGMSAPTLTLDDLSASPSFDMAPKAGLTPMQRQMLLEIQDENTRLVLLREHYKDVMPAVTTADAIQRVIRNDGYLRPKAD
jgi:Lon protease-like protein